MDKLLIVTPLAVSFVTTLLQPSMDSIPRTKSWMEPPGWMFGVMWSALYFILGWVLYSTYKLTDTKAFWLLVCTILLSYSWTFAYTSRLDKRVSYYMLFIILAFSIWCSLELGKAGLVNYQAMLLPFQLWLTAAIGLQAGSSFPAPTPTPTA